MGEGDTVGSIVGEGSGVPVAAGVSVGTGDGVRSAASGWLQAARSARTTGKIYALYMIFIAAAHSGVPRAVGTQFMAVQRVPKLTLSFSYLYDAHSHEQFPRSLQCTAIAPVELDNERNHPVKNARIVQPAAIDRSKSKIGD